MKKQKISKLDINLFPETTSEEVYNKAKAKFVGEYTKYIESTIQYHGGGMFFQDILLDKLVIQKKILLEEN